MMADKEDDYDYETPVPKGVVDIHGALRKVIGFEHETSCPICGRTNIVAMRLWLDPINYEPNNVLVHPKCGGHWTFKQPSFFPIKREQE